MRKVFAQGRREIVALDQVSLTVAAGEFVSVMGPSGSGKSTLLYLAAGFDRPTQGEVHFDGRALHAMTDEELTRMRRSRIGFVFQQFHLIPTLTVLENAALPLLLSGGRMTDVQGRVQTMLEQVGLAARASHFPEELSGGEMQRVAVARALIADPAVVLADEPTGNLDSVTGEGVLKLLKDLSARRTVIMVTHDPHAAAFGHRTLKLRDGRLE